MKRERRDKLTFIGFLAVILCLSGACSLPSRRVHSARGEGIEQERTEAHLTRAQHYAGEILSYLVRVVLGREGRPERRKEWAMVGLHEKPDLADLYEMMTNPERSLRNVMVPDANILELSQVLYTYDENLSFSKGRFGLIDIYPAPEFLAIRLLLLQKIHKNEKIHLQALLEKKEMLFDKNMAVSERDLEEVNLSREEMALVRAIIQKMPDIYAYLNDPFLVKALYDLGAVEKDAFVKGKIAQANYKDFPSRYCGGAREPGALKIAILPSMTREFYFGDQGAVLPPYGFCPTKVFVAMVEKLEHEILACTERILSRKMSRENAEDNSVQETLQKKISFYVQDLRPLVIYPGNVEEVIHDVCPGADFTVILLGKNVYLALDLQEPEKGSSPSNWSYIDISDVQHAQIQEECERIAEVIYAKLDKHW